MDIKQYLFNVKNNLQVEVVDMENLVKTSHKWLLVPHRTNFYHIFLFENCCPKHIVDFETISIQSNSLLFLDKGRVHQFDANLNYKGKILIFTDDFYCIHPQDGQYLKRNILFNDFIGKPNLWVGQSLAHFMTLYKTIGNELQKENDCVKSEILKNYVHTLLLLSEREKRRQGFQEIPKGRDLDYVLLFKDFLEKHFKNTKTVKIYCEKLSVSEKRLYKSTTKILGKTPKQMIDDRVLLEAKRILVHETQTVKEIAYHLGFDEPTNFIKYFRKHTQMTPSEFRESPHS